MEVIHPTLFGIKIEKYRRKEIINETINHCLKPSSYALVSTPFALLYPRARTWVRQGRHLRVQNFRKHPLLGLCKCQLCTGTTLSVSASLRKPDLHGLRVRASLAFCDPLSIPSGRAPICLPECPWPQVASTDTEVGQALLPQAAAPLWGAWCYTDSFGLQVTRRLTHTPLSPTP